MPPKLRILCLHGYAQNATFFRKRTGSLRTSTKAIAEYHFLDAPFPATAAFLAGGSADDRGEMLSWWQWEDAERAATSTEYLGLETTLERVRSCLAEHGPFDGVLGFSQGATLAALLCLRPPRAFRFAVLISGFVPRDPAHASYFEAPPLPLPSLHVIGEADERVPPPVCRRLASCFEAPTFHVHDGGHATPSDAPFRQLLKQFIAAQHVGPSAGGGGGESGGGKSGKNGKGGGGGKGGGSGGDSGDSGGCGRSLPLEDAAADCQYTRAYASWRAIRGVCAA